MKKFRMIGCAFLGMLYLALCGCSSSAPQSVEIEEEPVAVTLTSENFSDYIILDVKIDDFEEENQIGLFGNEYRGAATLSATASLRKDVEVDSVIIEGRIVTDGLAWALNVYNFTLELNKDGEANYSDTIYSGEFGLLRPESPTIMSTPMLDMALSLNENEFITSVDNDGGVAIQVSGTIYE